MYVYVFRYQFSPEVTDTQIFSLQVLAVATLNKMGCQDFWNGFEVSASGPIRNYCGIIQNVEPGFEAFYANAKFVAATAWAKPPLAEFTSFIFNTNLGAAKEVAPQTV